jgi:succinate dehydrogenase/fumarate reductase cytochrome b subunit
LQHCFGVATATTYCNEDSRGQSKIDSQLQRFLGVATIAFLLQHELVAEAALDWASYMIYYEKIQFTVKIELD